MTSRPTIEVVCGLIENQDGHLLVARRPAGKHLGGLWEFPGGKVEPGETLAAALRREIGEELGCDLEVGLALTPVQHSYPTVTVRLNPFLARLQPANVHPEAREHDELRWVTAAELSALDMPAADAPIVVEWMEQRGLRDASSQNELSRNRASGGRVAG